VLETPDVGIRRARPEDAQAIAAVFDAAVRARWTFMGEVASRPMFAPEDRDRLVADHAPPNILPAGTDQARQVLGYGAGGLCQRGLSPRRIGPRIGLERRPDP
jgi:hypothetical protein